MPTPPELDSAQISYKFLQSAHPGSTKASQSMGLKKKQQQPAEG